MGLRVSARLAPGNWLSRGLGGHHRRVRVARKGEFNPGAKRLDKAMKGYRFPEDKAWAMGQAKMCVVTREGCLTMVVQKRQDGSWHQVPMVELQARYGLEPVEVHLLINGFKRLAKVGFLDTPVAITTALMLREELVN